MNAAGVRASAAFFPMRSASLADCLTSLGPAFPAGLFPAGSIDAMRDAVTTIPWSMLSLFGFERPLDDPHAGADILFAANVATGGRDVLAGRNPAVRFSAPWHPIARFCERWNEPSSLLYAGADDVWFEYDIGSATGDPSGPPSFFFGPRVGHAADPGYDAKPVMRAILHDGFEALLAEPLAGDTAAALDRCLAVLPDHARIFQTGLMLSRPSRQIRICIDNLSSAGIAELVAATRGAADAEHVARELARVEAATPLIVRLALDLGDGIGPKIGVECTARDWRPLLDLLVGDGACDAGVRDALLDLRPVVRAADLAAPWPSDDTTEMLSALIARELALAIKLHHVKLTIERDRPTRAKGYISVERVWLA